jgi:hypothetical protein
MGSISLDGKWQIRVVGKESSWPQRVVISGSSSLVIPGIVGQSATVSGKRSLLSIQHELNGQWLDNPLVQRGPARVQAGRTIMTVVTKDYFWEGDSDPDDLVLELVQLTGAADFGVVGLGGADGWLHTVSLSSPDAQYLAVGIQNTGSEQLDYDMVLAVSSSGSTALSASGISLRGWSDAARQATDQETAGDGVMVPPLEPGQRATVYFPVDSSGARPGPVEVELELRHARGGPGTGMHCSARTEIAADVPGVTARRPAWETDPQAGTQVQAGTQGLRGAQTLAGTQALAGMQPLAGMQAQGGTQAQAMTQAAAQGQPAQAQPASPAPAAMQVQAGTPMRRNQAAQRSAMRPAMPAAEPREPR